MPARGEEACCHRSRCVQGGARRRWAMWNAQCCAPRSALGARQMPRRARAASEYHGMARRAWKLTVAHASGPQHLGNPHVRGGVVGRVVRDMDQDGRCWIRGNMLHMMGGCPLAAAHPDGFGPDDGNQHFFEPPVLPRLSRKGSTLVRCQHYICRCERYGRCRELWRSLECDWVPSPDARCCRPCRLSLPLVLVVGTVPRRVVTQP